MKLRLELDTQGQGSRKLKPRAPLHYHSTLTWAKRVDEGSPEAGVNRRCQEKGDTLAERVVLQDPSEEGGWCVEGLRDCQ